MRNIFGRGFSLQIPAHYHTVVKAANGKKR